MNLYRLVLVIAAIIGIVTISTISASLFAPIEPTDAEGCSDVHMSWKYKGHHISTGVCIPRSDLEGYGNSIVPRCFCVCSYDRYVTPADSTVVQIADHLKSVTEGMDDLERLHAVNSFINQTIEYESDSVMHGIPDYYQYPAETVYSGKGDCEDSAFLEISVLRAMGYDAVPLFTHDHCLVGVNIEGTGNNTDVIGTAYYHLDPTTGESLGSSEYPDGGLITITKGFSMAILGIVVCAMLLLVYAFRRF